MADAPSFSTRASPRRWLALALLFLMWLAPGARAGEASWQPGLTRADVMRLLGPPRSTTQIGGREYLYYADNVRIEIRAGIVTAIEGRVPDALRPPGATPPASTTPAAAPPPPAAPPLASAAPPPPPPTPPPPAATADTDAQTIAQLENPASALPPEAQAALGTMAPARPAPAAPASTSAPSIVPIEPADEDVSEDRPNLLVFAFVGFGFYVLLQTVILKVAFNITGFPGLWRDLFKVAIAANVLDLLIQSLLGLMSDDWRAIYESTRIGPILNLVLLAWLILKFTDVKQLGTAFSIALAAAILPIVAVLLGGSFIASFVHWLTNL